MKNLLSFFYLSQQKKIFEQKNTPFYLSISENSRNFAHMIELERHIEILLLNNDCVIVPGIGGFMAYHVEARYDESDHTFLPPLRALGFNPQLTSLNDSLLAQSYVEAYDISYPEAVKRIGDEVREIRQRISHDGSYELHNIGVITINDDGNFEFEPCEAGILTPSLYGLGSFAFQSISATTEQEEPAQTPLASITDETEDKTISIRLSLLRNLAAEIGRASCRERV